jgi:two-component system chemotaxis response regulator CheB
MSQGDNKKIRVLIVDDSSVIRTLMSRILASDPGIEVVGTAPDPYVAREKLAALKPDVMTLDIEMPRMDGVTFLGKVMKHFPTRTVVISSLSTQGSAVALRALENGAVDVLAKPSVDVGTSLEQMGRQIIETVKAASRANLSAPRARPVVVGSAVPGGVAASAQAAVASATVKAGNAFSLKTTHQVLAIASSTGGTEALKVLLPALPADVPGTVIVQHMPPVFTKTYAEHLQRLCPFEVKEAEEGDRVLPGRVLLAPGNFHMELSRSGAYYQVRLHQEPMIHGVRPAADYLMRSVARHAGANAIGVVLTGMGRDGAAGLLAMREAGAFTIAQDERSSVVYGMPRAAVELGAVSRVLPLEQIASELAGFWKKNAA